MVRTFWLFGFLLLLTSCTTYVAPFFDGHKQGVYVYQKEVNGVLSTVENSSSFDLRATVDGASRYTFAGTLTFLDETHRLEGFEHYPSGIRNLGVSESSGVRANLFEGATLVYKLCGAGSYPYDYTRGVALSVYPAPKTGCEDAVGQVGVLRFR